MKSYSVQKVFSRWKESEMKFLFFLNSDFSTVVKYVRGCIQKFSDSVDNEIYAYNNKHSLRSNTKGYGGKTH
jgi:hypothetical protein